MPSILATPDWSPFRLDSHELYAPRPIHAPGFGGIGDRLRTAAFAELQAEAAFLWAAEHFEFSTSVELRQTWRFLAAEEKKHRCWLFDRMSALGVDVRERPVRDALWERLIRCETAREFCYYMSDAERRGKKAGERFAESLKAIDFESAEVFRKIAEEETRHIEVAHQFFPDLVGGLL